MLLLILLMLVACGDGEENHPEQAARAADAFLEMLVAKEIDQAWGTLTPATQRAAYGNDMEAFAEEVANAHWEQMRWRVQQPVWLDISWAVYVAVEGGSTVVPAFLLERGIVDVWQEGDGAIVRDRGILLLVQRTTFGTWVVPGKGLDQRQAE